LSRLTALNIGYFAIGNIWNSTIKAKSIKCYLQLLKQRQAIVPLNAIILSTCGIRETFSGILKMNRTIYSY